MDDFECQIRELIRGEIDIVNSKGIQWDRTQWRRLVNGYYLETTLLCSFEKRKRQFRIIHAPATVWINLRRVQLQSDRLGHLLELFIQITQTHVEALRRIDAYIADESMWPSP